MSLIYDAFNNAYSPWITTTDNTADNIYTNGTYNNFGTYTNYPYSQGGIKNPLKDLDYYVEFEIDKNKILSSKIRSIRKNKFIFECDYVGNRIQPYEFIMKLIERDDKFSVKVKVSDVLTLTYVNFRFTKIENNLDFNDNSLCDFSKLEVRFECEKILYENHKLSEKELRTDKLNKINEQNNEGNNSKR